MLGALAAVTMAAAAVVVPASAADAGQPRTELISIDSTGTPGDLSSAQGVVSGDGRFVAFISESTMANARIGRDDNEDLDVYLRDRETDQTTLVSETSAGTYSDYRSWQPAISMHGRFVAFVSLSTDLVSGDTNGASDVFVRDRRDGTTTRVSVSSAELQANGASPDGGGDSAPAISAFGRFVVFASEATNLVPHDTNGASDVFVRDRELGTTRRVDVSSTGRQANAGVCLSQTSFHAVAVSDDGRYVAFCSLASNLVPGDRNGQPDVFVRDTLRGTTQRVSVSSFGGGGNAASADPQISGDGHLVAFTSDASNLVPGDHNGMTDVFVRNLMTGRTTRVSISSRGREASDASEAPAISDGGRFVAFASSASNLVGGDTNGYPDVFVRDRALHTTTRASVSTAGVQADHPSYDPEISDDGTVVSFVSSADNLNPLDEDNSLDIFARVH